MRQVAKKGLLTVMATGGVLMAAGGGAAYADAGAAGMSAGSPGVGSGNTVQVPVHVPVNACGNTVDVIGLLNPVFGNHCANTSSGLNGTGGGATAKGGTAHSPGVGSGNTVQAPIDIPVNACGNTADVAALLSPAFGDRCGNEEASHPNPGGPIHPGHPVTRVTRATPVTPAGRATRVTPGIRATPSTTARRHTTPATPATRAGRASPEPRGTPGTPGTPGTAGTPSTPGQPGHPGIPGTTSGGHTTPASYTPSAGSRTPATQTLAHTGTDGMGLTGASAGALLLGGALLYRRGRAAQR